MIQENSFVYKKVIRYEMNEMESGGKSEDGVWSELEIPPLGTHGNPS